MEMIFVKINKQMLLPFMMYNNPIRYSENIVLYPILMKDILIFQSLESSITLRKNSTFREKKIIKMSYLDFLLFSAGNMELEIQYNILGLSNYYYHAIKLLQLCCKDSDIRIDKDTGKFTINGEIVTSKIFDDLRRIIIIQNDIDFDIDEFINYDTEQRLLKAQKDLSRNDDSVSIEDYIDSLVIAMHVTEEYVMNMTIRKFWRYIKRYNLHETYTIAKTGECSGFVKFNEPIKHWMCSIDNDDEDKYKNLKTDESELKNKVI